MKHLKLVVNNIKNNESNFFDKHELQLILNLYAKMVSTGDWKDYGLAISKKEINFNVYHQTSEYPAYKIIKNLKPKNKEEKYLVKDSANKVIKKSENLSLLIGKITWKKFKLVN